MYNLPYDYSRCMGKKEKQSNGLYNPHPTCADCMRRLSPGRERWQSFIAGVPAQDGTCTIKISVEQWNKSC